MDILQVVNAFCDNTVHVALILSPSFNWSNYEDIHQREREQLSGTYWATTYNFLLPNQIRQLKKTKNSPHQSKRNPVSIFSFGLVQISPHATLGYSRKNPHLHDGRNGGKSHGRRGGAGWGDWGLGGLWCWKSRWVGGSEPKDKFWSLQSISFSKIA